MQVYIELAVLENFCMDFTLLYAAKLLSKNRAHVLRLMTAAAFGACFAVVFPLFTLHPAFSVALKIAAGLVICLIAGKYPSVKSFVRFCALFLVFTAGVGGALIGVFSLTGISYVEGAGFALSSVPIGIPLFCALVAVIIARRLAAKFARVKKNTVMCRIYAGQSHVEISGFFDSGNKVYLRGQPVSVIPQAVAEKLCDIAAVRDGVKIHTVAGSKIIKVFSADRLEIIDGEKTEIIKNVKIGVSPYAVKGAVLHGDLLEEFKCLKS